MQNQKLFDAIADIAYAAGYNNHYSGNSRLDIAEYIHLAKQFKKIHKRTNWDEFIYMLEIEKFAEAKLNC
jgi:hypothetical protein